MTKTLSNEHDIDDLDRLVDRNELAAFLGVGPTAISNYVSRNSPHAPFPEPLITRANGRFKLWDVFDIEDWHCDAFPSRTDLWDRNVVGYLRDLRAGA